MDLTDLAHDRDSWWTLVKAVMNLRVPKMREISRLRTGWILRKDSAPWNK